MPKITELLEKTEVLSSDYLVADNGTNTNKVTKGNLLKDVTEVVEDVKAINDAQEIRLDNVEAILNGQLSRTETTESTSTELLAPKGTSGARVNYIGGASRKGKNLLNSVMATKTSAGITCTNNGNGTYTLNGTATTYVEFYFLSVDGGSATEMTLTSGTYYLMSCNPRIYLRLAEGGSTKAYGSSIPATYTTTETKTNIKFKLAIDSGTTYTNEIVKPILTTDSTITTNDFEPYTPNLINAEVDDVVVYGKNLFNANNQVGTYSSAIYTISADGKITQSATDDSGWYISQKRNFTLESGTYTATIIGKKATTKLQMRNLTDDIDVFATQNNSYSFTLNATKKVAFKTHGVASDYPQSFYIQLEKGNVATSYEPYKELHHPINESILSLPNYGIGVNNVYNYVDYDRRVYFSGVGSVDLETLSFRSSGNYWHSDIAVPNVKTKTTNLITAKAYGTTIEQLVYTDNDKIALFADGRLYIPKATYVDTPTGELIYELSVPTETDISDLIPTDYVLDVKSNDRVVFHTLTDYHIDVPNKVSFNIDLKDINEDLRSNVERLNEEVSVERQRNDSQDRRIHLLEEASLGKLYTQETNTSYSNDVNVPSGALSLATLDMLGGMSRKVNQFVREYPTTNKSGIVCTNVGNGKLVVSGTNTTGDNHFFSTNLNLIANHKYAVSIGDLTAYKTSAIMIYSPISGVLLSVPISTAHNKYAFFTSTSNVTINYYLNFGNVGTTISGTICPMIFDLTVMGLENITTSAEVETIFPNDYYPYTEGSIVDGKVDDVVSYGKNLLNPTLNTTTQNGVTCTNNGNGTYTLNGTATTTFAFDIATFNFEANKQYRMVGCPSGGSYGTYCLNWAYANDVIGVAFTDSGLGSTITTTKSGTPTLGIRITNGTALNNLLFKPMITTDTSLTYNDFTPYKETHKPIPSSVQALPNYGIGVNNNVYNYLEFKDGRALYHENAYEVDLGALDWENAGTNVFISSDSIIQNAKGSGWNEIANCIQNRYALTTRGLCDTVDKQFALYNNGNTIFPRIHDTSFTSAIDLKLSLTNVMLYCELATEIITDVTDLFPLNFNELEVEANGHISFHYDNDYKVDVPSTISYLIDLKGALNG